MQIDEYTRLWLSDVLVPDVFITDYLPKLTPEAVKVYIYSLHVARHHLKVSQDELLAHLGLDEQRLKDALLELAQFNVIHVLNKGDKYTMNDLKELELEKHYSAKQVEPPSDMIKRLAKDKAKMATANQISDTFFHGQIGMKWVHFIDDCYHEYAFEPDVVYALFAEASSLRKLDGMAYVRQVAKFWYQADVKTYADLAAYSKARDRVKRIVHQVGKKLRRNMGEPEEALVNRWVMEYGYDFKVIGRALDCSVKAVNPGLNYFDAILKEWHDAGLKTAEAVEAYEAERSQRRARAGSASGGVSAARSGGNARESAFGNFQQRDYSDEFLHGFYEELSETEPVMKVKTEPKGGLPARAPTASAEKGVGAPDEPSSGSGSGLNGCIETGRNSNGQP